MRFLGNDTFEVKVALLVKDAKLLADACSLAVDRLENPEEEELRDKLAWCQGFFEAAAVLCAIDQDFPPRRLEDRNEWLEEIGLREFVDNGRQTLGEFVESPAED